MDIEKIIIVEFDSISNALGYLEDSGNYFSFKVGDLIWAFVIYFIFWHSIPSLLDQIKFLYGKVSLKNFKAYFKSAFLYWLISLFGIVVLYFLLKDYKIFDSIFFSFLAAITFPHVFVIERMFNLKHKKTE
jgi:Brp/Blh family beta-carotene 15,15'-monooxygenase